MSRKVTFKKNKKNDNIYDVKFENLTLGEVMTIKSALSLYAQEGSAIANDVLAYIRNGLIESTDERLKDNLK